MRIYLMAGEQESSSMVADLVAMYNTLMNAGFGEEEVLLLTHPDGQHSEWYWAREFPAAYEWLFANSTTSTNNDLYDDFQLNLSPNPTDSLLHLNTADNFPFSDLRIVIYSVDGRRVSPPLLVEGNQMDVSFLQNGLYVFKVFAGEQLWGSQKVVISH